MKQYRITILLALICGTLIFLTNTLSYSKADRIYVRHYVRNYKEAWNQKPIYSVVSISHEKMKELCDHINSIFRENLIIKKETMLYIGNETQYGNTTIEINYPQIYRHQNTNRIVRSNDLLKEAAYILYGENFDTASDCIDEIMNSSSYEYALIDYELLHMSDDYISIIYDVFATGGGTAYFHNYPVTVDLNTGKYIYLYDITSADKVLDAVRNGNFTVYIGLYSEVCEADVHEKDVIDLMLQELKTSLKETADTDSFDMYSSQNIGLDKEYLYLFFTFWGTGTESFHGYYIISIPVEDISS